MSLRIACVVLTNRLSVLAVLEAALLRRPEGVCTSGWAIALGCISVLRGWRSLAVALLAVLARRLVALLAIPLLRVLVVGV